MPERPSLSLTLADLVVVSMLSERPMHGYGVWAELVLRQVHKWAAISKPQVYYSLRKLEAAGCIEVAGDADAALGPERRMLRPTSDGHRAMADTLARAKWAKQRPPSPFSTWLVLSWLARPRDLVAQLSRRRTFIEQQLEEDRQALREIVAGTSPSSDAAMVVRLGIRQFEVELEWLDEVAARQRPG